MRIAVIGTGYVGLVVGAGFADFGHSVTCVDVDLARVEMLQAGRVPIHEPGLSELVRKHLSEERLHFSTQLGDAIPGAQVVFIAVGTPEGPDGAADLSQVLTVARTIGPHLTGFTVVVSKSTVPVGSTEQLQSVIAETAAHEFAVVSNPEFLKEGDALDDFMRPARIVIGSSDPRAIEVMRRLYAPMQRIGDRLLVMDARSAELAKYAANAMLATRVSLMNELSLLAEAIGADIDAVRRAVGLDPRIGSKFLFPGPGFGGSCFPKDLHALAKTARDAGVEPLITNAVIETNQRQLRVLGRRVAERFGGALRGARIGLWGLSFKAETDDVRGSPAFALIEDLLAAGARPVGFDPVAGKHARERFGEALELAPDMYGAARGADALCVLTEWKIFRQPDFAVLRNTMRTPNLFDGRNLWTRGEVEPMGFWYYGIGRGAGEVR